MEPYLDHVVAAVNAVTRNSYAFIAMPLPPKPSRPASNPLDDRDDQG